MVMFCIADTKADKIKGNGGETTMKFFTFSLARK